MGLYYEDLAVGAEYVTASRTVTEADVVSFAMLSGDWNPIHVDAETAGQGAFGQRVVHGMCCFSIMGGLMYAAGWFSDTMIALLGYRDWRFVAPVLIGDTLTCRFRVEQKRLTRSGERGLVDRHLSLWNQRGVCVQEGSSPALIRLRPRESNDSAGK
ncbi:MaoC/PaaZ C-terminal domain-containing protein [Rhizomonospora bruguierae]|uniref:MaoC/PaaZ C-terminal domain-containing protein n=1 Tax=Rhizomonospora bruguierae TaxID=1581705 RepID=UPI001BCE7D11|nr:MaoC/PaaZ C-terminal domain-containing protein [Micromonospora sp. NBRC 107566]